MYKCIYSIFRNEAFRARTLVAAVDHNNISRQHSVSLDGAGKYHRAYSKRSKNWHAYVVNENKSYDYWPTLTTHILEKRISDKSNVLKKTEVTAEHPKKIASTIAMKEAPKTADIVQKSLSRFSKSSSDGFECSNAAKETDK